LINVICIPYGSLKEKRKITTELNKSGQRYSDLGGVIFMEKRTKDDYEMSVAKMCYIERHNK